jgi:recombination protein RecT
MNSPMPTDQRSGETLKSLMAKPENIKRIQDIAPKYLSADRLVKILLLTVSRDSKLMRCTPQSLLAAVMRVAQYGLEPDGRLAYLIPFKDQVNVIVGYMGLLEIARRNGIHAVAFLVHERDAFEFMHDDGTGRGLLKHVPALVEDRGPIILAYSRAVRIDGTGPVDYEIMLKSEIDLIRKRSAAGGEGPWVTDFGEMARKTVLRRHSKRWPLCAEDRTAVEDDDAPEHLQGRVTVAPAEPRRPIFNKPQEDEDDIPYTPPEPELKKVKKKEPPSPAPVVEVQTEQPGNAQRLQKLIEDEGGGTFAILQGTLVDLGHAEAPTWPDWEAVPESVATMILNSPRGFLRAMEAKKEELKEAGV